LPTCCDSCGLIEKWTSRELKLQRTAAKRNLGKACDIHERVLGADTPEAATIRGHLATILLDQKKFAEAEPLLRQSLTDQISSYGEGHPELFLPLTRLAKAERLAGKPDAAEQSLRKALPLRSRSAAKRVAVFDAEIRSLSDHFDRQGDKVRASALRESIVLKP
jgi:hypothetical protein